MFGQNFKDCTRVRAHRDDVDSTEKEISYDPGFVFAVTSLQPDFLPPPTYHERQRGVQDHLADGSVRFDCTWWLDASGRRVILSGFRSGVLSVVLASPP